ncbi:MAG: acyl-CoA dehydrogenase family protein [Candidatus Sericytochromatia bacterium]
MSSRFEEFHAELRSVAGDLLAKDRAVDWPLLVQAGWVGLEVPDEFGGAGATFREASVVCGEMGRAASANAYLGSAVLAVGALTELAPTSRRDQLLAGIAAGTVRAAGVIGPFALDGQRLTGKADFVPDAADADVLLVTATDSGGVPVLVETTEATVTSQPVLDETRRLATVNADRVATESVWPFSQPQRLLDRAAVAVACDSLGVAEAMLAASVSYARVRQQFGRPIGSFQAVKHACADMAVSISIVRQLVGDAADAVAGDRPDAGSAASMAKSYACSTAVNVAGKAMQLHGGIGYTWESGVHVYLKRAALNRSLFGSPAEHRKHLAQRYLANFQATGQE